MVQHTQQQNTIGYNRMRLDNQSQPVWLLS